MHKEVDKQKSYQFQFTRSKIMSEWMKLSNSEYWANMVRTKSSYLVIGE
jgi:hypothetical protein